MAANPDTVVIFSANHVSFTTCRHDVEAAVRGVVADNDSITSDGFTTTSRSSFGRLAFGLLVEEAVLLTSSTSVDPDDGCCCCRSRS